MDRPVSESAAERFARDSLECLRLNGAPGALWWMYADCGPGVLRQPPFDHFDAEGKLGLLRDDWSPKPVLNGLLSVSRQGTTGRPDPGWFDVDPEWYFRDPLQEIPRLYARFRERLVLPRD
jgi:hypothetical protein